MSRTPAKLWIPLGLVAAMVTAAHPAAALANEFALEGVLSSSACPNDQYVLAFAAHNSLDPEAWTASLTLANLVPQDPLQLRIAAHAGSSWAGFFTTPNAACNVLLAFEIPTMAHDVRAGGCLPTHALPPGTSFCTAPTPWGIDKVQATLCDAHIKNGCVEGPATFVNL